MGQEQPAEPGGDHDREVEDAGLHRSGDALGFRDLLADGGLVHRHQRTESEAPEKERDMRDADGSPERSEEHTSELQSLMRISYAVLCLKKKKQSTMKESNVTTH